MSLSSLSIRHQGVLVVALVTVVVSGLIAVDRLPRQEDPQLTWRLANVITRLSGTSPERIEALVTDVLERAVEQVDEVEHVYSVSRAGVSLIQIELSDDVTSAEPVWQNVRHKLNEAALQLPDGVIGPELDDEIMGTFSLLLAVTSPQHSYRELKDVAQLVDDELRYLPSTASTTLFGTQREVIYVEVDAAKLAAYDLTFREVARVLAGRNTRQPSGRLRVDHSDLVIEASGEFKRESQITRTVLMVTKSGRSIHVGDVARVRRSTVSPAEPLARVDGIRAVVIGARARRTVRVDHYGDEVEALLARALARFPDGMKCEVVHNNARYTRQRADDLSRTLLLSITGVFFSSALFMGVRAAGIVTLSVPLTGLTVIAVFLLIGVPLNQMSVMAVIMAMGMVVDNSIVIVEQLHRSARAGADLKVAAAEEPTKLLLPLVVATLTTVAAFLPIYLLPGGTGEFVRAIPIGVATCLAASLVIAVTVVPWLCWRLFPRNLPARHATASWLRPRYVGLLRQAVARPLFILAPMTIMMVLLASTGFWLRRDFFSPVQRDQFIVDVFAPQGSDISYTSQIVGEIESVFAGTEGVESVTSFIGRNAPLVFYNLTSQETYATHFAQLIVRVSDWSQTARLASLTQSQLNAEISGADCCIHVLEHGAPFLAPFEVRVRGPAIPTLHEIARRIAQRMQATPGVRNLRMNYANESLKLVAEVNEPVARNVGIDQATVADEMHARLDGMFASYLREGDERIDILVRLPIEQRNELADLRAMYIKPRPDARLIPLSSIADLRPVWEAASIYRRDGERTLSVLAYPEFGRTAAHVSTGFAHEIQQIANVLPAGYTVQLGGENEQREEAERQLLNNAIYALFIVLLLLMIEFHSFRLAAVILSIVPLALAGVMVTLWLTGWPLNFMAIMGMMMLIGIAVNDAVILVDGYERARRAGVSLPARVMRVTLTRTRHVIITTVTTIAGFLPLALSPSLLWPPLAIAIIGGLSLATVLTLAGIPAAYVLACAGECRSHPVNA